MPTNNSSWTDAEIAEHAQELVDIYFDEAAVSSFKFNEGDIFILIPQLRDQLKLEGTMAESDIERLLSSFRELMTIKIRTTHGNA